MALRRVGMGRGLVGEIAGGLSSGASGGGDFSPADLAGLALWLKADAGVDKDDGSGGYIAAANGDPVSRWQDQSGNGRHAVQATAANQPLYVAGALNGLPALDWDGTNDYLRTATTGAIAQPLTYFIVYNQITSFQSVLIDTASGASCQLFGSSPNFLNTFRVNAGSTLRTDNSALGWNIGAVVINGGSSKIWRNAADPVTGSAGANGTNGWTIGNRNDLAQRWKDKIAEFLVYSGALSDANVDQVRDYLNTKYGSIY